jgi:phytoene/squalene synthetase
LLAYCRRSANPVGHLVLGLAGCDAPPNRGWSDEICTGLQLTNFWQDLAGDYQRGRIYLPREAWRAAGYGEADFASHKSNDAFRRMLAAAVERAEAHFHRGKPLLQHVPPWLRSDIRLFREGGLTILARIRKIGYDVWNQRPTLSKWDKLGIGLAATFQGLVGRPFRKR